MTGDDGTLSLMSNQLDDTPDPKHSTLELGLATVARHVRNAEGQLRLNPKKERGHDL